MNKPYLAISYYHFFSIENPEEEVKRQKAFIADKEITSRIYISEKGVNGQLSATYEDGTAYIDWLKSREEYDGANFKIQEWNEQIFPRKCVKYRKHLVGYDEEIDLDKRGEYLDPKEWKKHLENDSDKVLIDVRNDYEWKVGHFDGAELPKCSTFREFKQYAENLKNTKDPENTPVMMYCTGGIRCELYSSILKEKGFKKVYQLEGGVINYGQQVGQKHWLGKLFVFDDRMVVPIADEEDSVIGTCDSCEAKTDHYYNCANMDCNKLFLACGTCLEKHKGCCQESCACASRVRPLDQQNPHKPFRKWHHYFSDKSATA